VPSLVVARVPAVCADCGTPRYMIFSMLMFSSFGNPPAALWPWGRLSLLQNEYQWYLKGGGLRGELMPPVRRADNLANFVGADWLAVLGASTS
jgi:hypothetical protein